MTGADFYFLQIPLNPKPLEKNKLQPVASEEKTIKLTIFKLLHFYF